MLVRILNFFNKPLRDEKEEEKDQVRIPRSTPIMMPEEEESRDVTFKYPKTTDCHRPRV